MVVMNIPKQANEFLNGTGPSVMPKHVLYETAVRLYKLERAMQHGYRSIEEYDRACELATEAWYEQTFGIKGDDYAKE